jgi:PAS domain S-box-containing protein
MRQLPRDGTIQNYEAQLRRRSGEVRDIIASLRLIELVGEREPVCITMFIDITERKAAERALREDEQWLKAIFDQAAVGVVQFDVTTGNFVRANQRFCDMLGYPREEMARRTQAEITYPHDRGVDEENLARLRAGTIREFAREKRFVRKDGSLVWASIAVSAIGAPGAPPTAFVGVVQDISERKRLDEHFLQAQKMEALGQFSGGVAHDFNNILMAISGYTELSQLSLRENPEVHDNLTLVLQAARRASDLVRQILTFSRQQPQVRQSILLQPVVEETLKLLRATIPSTIAFDRAVAPDAPTVLADANQVHQVLMNLGTNAWYAMKDRPGRLQVKLESFSVDAAYAAAQPPLRPGIYARVSVADTGCGMDPATLRRIFEPFFTTKPPGEGTGLGLAVVHGIMESHDGAVTVHSQPGEGTEFRLYFPAHASAAAGTAAPAGAVPRGHGERVLVVDDEELLAQLVQKALTLLGYQAEAVTQPAAALALVLADPARFALVLTDQTMPGMTGLGLAAELRKIRPDLPVILMTGHGAALTPERIQAAGIRQLLPKPIGIPSLGAAVHAVLSAPSLR